jgi:hypothetical protein
MTISFVILLISIFLHMKFSPPYTSLDLAQYLLSDWLWMHELYMSFR